jgi:hypothetical protein
MKSEADRDNGKVHFNSAVEVLNRELGQQSGHVAVTGVVEGASRRP